MISGGTRQDERADSIHKPFRIIAGGGCEGGLPGTGREVPIFGQVTVTNTLLIGLR